MTTYKGGCKCGAVAFEADGEIEKLVECNCSMCRPKGYLHWFVKDPGFRLLKGEDAMGAFKFNKQVLNHRFCLTCGVSPIVQGPGTTAVNARCIAGLDIHAIQVDQFDGAKL